MIEKILKSSSIQLSILIAILSLHFSCGGSSDSDSSEPINQRSATDYISNALGGDVGFESDNVLLTNLLVEKVNYAEVNPNVYSNGNERKPIAVIRVVPVKWTDDNKLVGVKGMYDVIAPEVGGMVHTPNAQPAITPYDKPQVWVEIVVYNDSDTSYLNKLLQGFTVNSKLWPRKMIKSPSARLFIYNQIMDAKVKFSRYYQDDYYKTGIVEFDLVAVNDLKSVNSFANNPIKDFFDEHYDINVENVKKLNFGKSVGFDSTYLVQTKSYKDSIDIMVNVSQYDKERLGYYVGDVFWNKSNGSGVEKLLDGSIYQGELNDGIRNGYGEYAKIIDGDTSFVYKGSWLDGDFHGDGKIVYPDGTVEENQFLKGCQSEIVSVNGEQREAVSIKNRLWMYEVLSNKEFSNGEAIKEVKSRKEWDDAVAAKEPAWCFMDFDSSTREEFGLVYNFYAVIDGRGICPKGWRLPELNDFVEDWNDRFGRIKLHSFNDYACLIKSRNHFSEYKNGRWFSSTSGGTSHQIRFWVSRSWNKEYHNDHLANHRKYTMGDSKVYGYATISGEDEIDTRWFTKMKGNSEYVYQLKHVFIPHGYCVRCVQE